MLKYCILELSDLSVFAEWLTIQNNGQH